MHLYRRLRLGSAASSADKSPCTSTRRPNPTPQHHVEANAHARRPAEQRKHPMRLRRSAGRTPQRQAQEKPHAPGRPAWTKRGSAQRRQNPMHLSRRLRPGTQHPAQTKAHAPVRDDPNPTPQHHAQANAHADGGRAEEAPHAPEAFRRRATATPGAGKNPMQLDGHGGPSVAAPSADRTPCTCTGASGQATQRPAPTKPHAPVRDGSNPTPQHHAQAKAPAGGRPAKGHARRRPPSQGPRPTNPTPQDTVSQRVR
jgi:hypothetical protein